jgi:hypothetical protein
MLSVAKAISVWVRNDIVQADSLVNGTTTIHDLSSSGGNVPQIAIDKLGNAIAVWQLYSDSTSIIQASYHNKGGSWSVVPKDLSSTGAVSPQIAMNSSGNAFVVWQINNGSNMIIQTTHYNKSTSSWSAVQTLSDESTNAFDPQISIDSLGNAIAIWSGNYNTRYITQVRYYTESTSSWSTIQNLSAEGKNTSEQQIVMNSVGDAVAVWTQLDGTNIVQASYYTKGVSWSTPQTLSAIGELTILPQISIDPLGNAIAVWEGGGDTNNVIRASYYTKGGSWSTIQNLSATDKNSSYPQISMDPLGNAIAIWNLNNGSNHIIQAIYYTKGVSWSTIQNLSADGENAFSSQITIDRLGNAIAVWERYNGSQFIIQARYYTKSTNSWSTFVEDLSATGENAVDPQIEIDNQVVPTINATVKFSINANYYTIITNLQALANYKNTLIDQIVAYTSAPRTTITILSILPGSIVNELTLPTEYVAALQNAVQNGFYITINGVTYQAIPGSFVIVDNICFQKGTMILTPSGYKSIESLTKGDLVTTAQGVIVKIQKVTSFVGKQDKCPLYVLSKDSLAPNMPLMDLYMSEGHAYRYNGKWSHMKCSSLAMKVDLNNVEYYNIAVDNYMENTLIANGVEVESLFNMKGLKMTWGCKTDNCKPIIILTK